MSAQVHEQIQEFAREALTQRRVLLAMLLTVLAVSAVAGLSVHRLGSYISTATIFVEDKKIIAPLMQGAAVHANVTDQAKIAKELIFGQHIIGRLVEASGLAGGAKTDVERDDVKNALQRRMRIQNIAQNLIRVEYRDADPRRAQAVTRLAVELFIAEGTDRKIEESREAFKFIEAQTQEYMTKLTDAERRLKEFRSMNVDARAGSEVEIGARIGQLQGDIDTTRTALSDAEVRHASLEGQLSGEAEVAFVFTREGQFRERIAELQNQIEGLRLNYHDAHPEILRLKYQIDDLTRAMLDEQNNGAKRQSRPGLTEGGAMVSPVYVQLKTEHAKARTEVDMLKGRLAQYNQQLQAEIARGRRVNVGEATLAEITRDYEINRDIYHDLLRRRENARVSMNLGRTEQGPAFRIQEPAILPVKRSGVRLVHILAGGLLLGILAPAGYVLARRTLDPRICRPALIGSELKLPVLAVVPQHLTREEAGALRHELAAITAMVVVGVGAFIVAGFLYSIGVI